MRELALLTFVTLDGVMQSPHDKDEDLSRDFSDGGWALDCWEPVMVQVGQEAMAEPYDLLLGRRTYDIFLGAHAASDRDDAEDMMTAATKYVATSHPESLTWANSIALTGDIPTEVEKLKQQDGPLLQVHGSWAIIQSLLLCNLVDEYRIWTFPVIAGRGKRLFEQAGDVQKLRLRKTAPTGNSGATMAIYRQASISEQ